MAHASPLAAHSIEHAASGNVTDRENTPRRGAILVVEDRDDVRQGLAQLLELNGFLVADARDGEDGLQQLTSDPEGIALILLDLMLPGAISGRDLRMRQLAEPSLRTVPTIVVTASDISQSERVGMSPDAWLDKPFRFDDLLALVKRYVVPERSGLQAEQKGQSFTDTGHGGTETRSLEIK